jgi:hypothetical protein
MLISPSIVFKKGGQPVQPGGSIKTGQPKICPLKEQHLARLG